MVLLGVAAAAKVVGVLFVLIGSAFALSSCGKPEETVTIVTIGGAQNSAPPPEPEEEKPLFTIDNVNVKEALTFSGVTADKEPVVEEARLFCTGCSDLTDERRIRLPSSEPLDRDTLSDLTGSYDTSVDLSFPSYTTYNTSEMPEYKPKSGYDNTKHRSSTNGDKRFMNHKDKRPDINIPRFTKCETKSGKSLEIADYSGGEGWQAGDGNCPMEIPEDAYWQEVKSDVVVTNGQTLIFPSSFLVCQKGGVIGFLDSGQVDESSELAKWLFNIEKPYQDAYLLKDSDGNIVEIKPQNVKDGYITIGAGHIIQTEEDAIKYGFDIEGMKWDGTLTPEDADYLIKKQQEKHETETDGNPAILSNNDTTALLEDDLNKEGGYRSTANRHAEGAPGAPFSENEMDAITSVVYNGNRANDPDNVLYHLLRRDKDGALNAMRRANYEGREGVFKRRLMEINMFFNDDYETSYSDGIEELKEKSGY